MTGQVNVGIIGAGRIGRVHAENLAYRIPEANVVAVADVFVEAAEKCQVAIIHPGKPTNPDEPGVEELIQRAAAFN